MSCSTAAGNIVTVVTNERVPHAGVRNIPKLMFANTVSLKSSIFNLGFHASPCL